MTASHTPAEPQGTIDMTATDSAVLAPCPFCGGEARAETGSATAWVECTAIGCDAHQSHRTPEAAIAAWNRRPESADDALLREALGSEWTGSDIQVSARLTAQKAIWGTMERLGYEPTPDAVKEFRAAAFGGLVAALKGQKP